MVWGVCPPQGLWAGDNRSSSHSQALMSEPLILREIHDADELEAVFRLRVRAWRARVTAFPDDLERWTDAFDARGFHWGVWDGRRLAAAGRLTVHDRLEDVPSPEVFQPVFPEGLAGRIGVLTRLVVDPDYAGTGLSRRLDEVRLEAARAQGCRTVIGSTYVGQSRLEVLKAAGFAVAGEAGDYASGPLRQVDGGGAIDGKPLDRSLVVLMELSLATS